MSGNHAPLDATIIICAYTLDRWDDLSAAMAALREQTRRPRQVVLVIDNNDELLTRAGQAFPEVDVVPNTHGPGASGGRNTGFALSEGSILVFLDDDTIPEHEWLEKLLAPLDDERVLGTGGALEPLWKDRAPDWLTDEFNWTIGCTYTGMPTEQAPIRNPICANMSVRKQVFIDAGGFEQALSRLDKGGVVTGTAEETEFCIRAAQRHPGRFWMYVPDARVKHVVPPGRGTWSYYRRRCRLEGASKAILTDLAGTDRGLESERNYVRSVLPRAVARELGRVLRGDLVAATRAASVIAGLWYTASAYAPARLQFVMGRRDLPAPSTS